MAQRVGRGIALLFHDCGTRRWWVVSSTPRPHFTPGKDPVPILREAGWAPGPVWTGGKSRPQRDSIPDRPTRSSVAVPTELPGPLSFSLCSSINTYKCSIFWSSDISMKACSSKVHVFQMQPSLHLWWWSLFVADVKQNCSYCFLLHITYSYEKGVVLLRCQSEVRFRADLMETYFSTHIILCYVQIRFGFMRWHSWSRHCATRRKVTGSIPDGVTGIFHWFDPSSHSVTLESTLPLTDTSTKVISWG